MQSDWSAPSCEGCEGVSLVRVVWEEGPPRGMGGSPLLGCDVS